VIGLSGNAAELSVWTMNDTREAMEQVSVSVSSVLAHLQSSSELLVVTGKRRLTPLRETREFGRQPATMIFLSRWGFCELNMPFASVIGISFLRPSVYN
jgi:hypothetical protein